VALSVCVLWCAVAAFGCADTSACAPQGSCTPACSAVGPARCRADPVLLGPCAILVFYSFLRSRAWPPSAACAGKVCCRIGSIALQGSGVLHNPVEGVGVCCASWLGVCAKACLTSALAKVSLWALSCAQVPARCVRLVRRLLSAASCEPSLSSSALAFWVVLASWLHFGMGLTRGTPHPTFEKASTVVCAPVHAAWHFP
jgi:hypothetical protein